MTDRELLELAAKAAGIHYDLERTNPHPKSGVFWGLWLLFDDEPSQYARRYFNPLTDDGDALRLSVQCKIDVKHYDGYVVAWFDAFFGTGRIAYNGDPCAATRRAIVLAAAEIGKQGGDKP